MPRIVSVVPAKPAVSTKHGSSLGPSVAERVPELTYELRASAEHLPTINCTKGVKNVWLGPKGLVRCNAFIHRYKKALAMSHTVGMVLTVGALYLPARIGRFIGVASCIFNFPGPIASFLVLRYDMIKVVMRTFEFWYLSTMNAIALALVAVLFSDCRSLTMLPALLSFEIVILIDTNYRAVNSTMRASVVSGVILCGFVVVAWLGLVSEATNPPIFSYGTRSMSVIDGIANCLSTVMLMLWRNAVRKYFVLDGSSAAVRCITYRCRVRLCVTSQTAALDSRTQGMTRKVLVRQSSSQARMSAPMAQLQFVQSTEVFQATHTLFQFVFEPGFHPLDSITCALLHAMSSIGITTTILVFFTDTGRAALPLVSAASTLLVCFVYACHTHRRLLRLLCASFDFAFVSLQFSIAHLCVCDALHWDVRCLGVLSSWLWVHWVLTIDAVPPILRVRLGYTRHLARLIVSIFIAAHVVLSLELIVWNRLELQDRAVVATTIGRHNVQVRTIAVLFGRMVTTLCWSCRLLVRLLRRAPDELVMLQGSVMYHDYERERRNRTSTGTFTSDMAIVRP